MRVAFLLTHAPGAPEFLRFGDEVEKAVSQGDQVDVFADVEGVTAALVGRDPDGPAVDGVLEGLVKRGVRLLVCRVCARTRGLHRGKEVLDGGHVGDLGDLSRLIGDADKVMSF